MHKPILIFLFTGNKEKIKTIRPLLESAGYKMVTVFDLNLPDLDVEENKPTFAGNALLKIHEALKAFGDILLRKYPEHHIIGLAEDSGMAIHALDGHMGLRPFPGVHSKRWKKSRAGKIVSQLARNVGILQLLRNKKRNGMMITAMAAIELTGQRTWVVHGEAPIWIARRPYGRPKWGYSNIIIYQRDKQHRTRAEIPDAEMHPFCQRHTATVSLIAALRKAHPRQMAS
jgi:non-canonical purine NTP pyrophosphatase (RdgB/HAM1 family)